MVNIGQQRSNALECYAIIELQYPLLQCFIRNVDFVWGSTHLTIRASLPLVKYYVLKIYIQSHHIKKIFKEYFKE